MSLQRSGVIIRALSGFYYVRCGTDEITCRAKGKFRRDGITPLVGDRVTLNVNDDGSGTLAEILPRRNCFARPSVANIDALVMIASNALPVTDPYLIDRITVRCEKNNCGVILVVNKCDIAPGDSLADIYKNTGYPVFLVSARTAQGLEELRGVLQGKICCFTGNSGVGKSSILNALDVRFSIPTGDVSTKLGRGRHTTRHVEFYALGNETYIADTPGFAAFGDETEEPILAGELQQLFPDFAKYRASCRFDDCTHRKEPGCAVREAVEAGEISQSRYASYLRLYEQAKNIKEWEL